MSWDEAESEAKKSVDGSGQDGLFIKLRDDGNKAEFAVVGDPYWYWKEGEFEGKPTKSKRFMMNSFVPGSGMKIWETNATTFTSLCSFKADVDLTRSCVRVKRVGKAGDKKTTYTFLPGAPITPELAKQIAATSLHNLKEQAEKSAERQFKDEGPRASYRYPEEAGRTQTTQQQMSVNEKDLPF